MSKHPPCENCGEKKSQLYCFNQDLRVAVLMHLCEDCWVIKYGRDDEGTDILPQIEER